jgi:SpoVK/Ycf46/Vps4 family AAA+-type ATPase
MSLRIAALTRPVHAFTEAPVLRRLDGLLFRPRRLSPLLTASVLRSRRPYDLDPAILRRLPRTFEVGMPDRSQRAAILEVLLEGENVEEGIDTQALADITEGYRWAHEKVSPVLERKQSRKEAMLASLLPRRRLLLPSAL